MNKIEELLTRRVEKIYPSKKALEEALRSGQKLKVYLGIDPRKPHLHLGHGVVLKKIQEFQNLGHKVIFLIGDFTALVGDPSDKRAVRPKMTQEKISQNVKLYQKQAEVFINFKGKNPAKLMSNSQWLSKLDLRDILDLASYFTTSQMLERDMFQTRLKEGKPLYLHEILYPLMQAYDSLAMDVDLEVGGTDQTFNMLCGRTLMKALKNKKKFVLTCKLLTGTDGQKMSKSLANYIPMLDSPNQRYGKIMSMKDELITQYFELCTNVPLEEIKKMEGEIKKGLVNPMDLKKQLAFEIVKMYHNKKEAEKAKKEFERIFQKRKMPREVKSLKLKVKSWSIVDLLIKSKLVKSRSEAKRLVEQGGVEVDGKKLEIPRPELGTKVGSWKLEIKDGMMLRVGKRRFVKLIISH